MEIKKILTWIIVGIILSGCAQSTAMIGPALTLASTGNASQAGLTFFTNKAVERETGMDTVSYVLAMEEISKVDASCSVIMSVNNSLVCWGIEKYGSEAQKEKYLPKLAKGEIIGAFCLSEPEAGSDATNRRIRACVQSAQC